jgi:serine/threonine protein kinase
VPSIRKYNDKISTEMEKIILKMTHKDPESRHSCAKELTGELKALQKQYQKKSQEPNSKTEKISLDQIFANKKISFSSLKKSS